MGVEMSESLANGAVLTEITFERCGGGRLSRGISERGRRRDTNRLKQADEHVGVRMKK
jgi:hypothetical protein